MSDCDRPATPPQSRSSANCISHSTASFSISIDLRPEIVVEELGSSSRTVLTTSKANAMWQLSSRNTQLVPAARPLSRPLRRRKYT